MRFLIVLSLLLTACHTLREQPAHEGDDVVPVASHDHEEHIATLLDDWHRAASVADEDGYLGSFAEDAVFLGTDATERWTLPEFSEYVHRYFVEERRGWTYKPRDRHIALHDDERMAWFDELLDHEGYGELRGTGVVRRTDEGWRIVHYNMTFTIPNDVGKDVVEVVKRFKDGP